MGNRTRVKTMLTEIGSGRGLRCRGIVMGLFEPVIVPKRKRRLDGIDQIVLSLTARGLTTGEELRHTSTRSIGGRWCKDTISRITEKVTRELAAWSSRPLDAIYSDDRRRRHRG